jgi:hypothetical protein
MFGDRKNREQLSGWLWEMYARSCREQARLRGLGNKIEAEHYERQARVIGGLLARMTQREHPITR